MHGKAVCSVLCYLQVFLVLLELLLFFSRQSMAPVSFAFNLLDASLKLYSLKKPDLQSTNKLNAQRSMKERQHTPAEKMNFYLVIANSILALCCSFVMLCKAGLQLRQLVL